MADEASVVLSADDEISGPALDAAASLENLKRAVNDVSSASAALPGQANMAAASVEGLGAASEHSAVPHRAAHQALNLVSRQVTELSGASAAAHGPLKIFDSILFSMAFSGGGVSMAFVGLTAALVTVTSIFTASSEAAKKQAEGIEEIKKKAVEAALATDGLAASQKKIAAIAAGETQKAMLTNKVAISEAQEKLKSLLETQNDQMVSQDGLIFRQVKASAATKGTNEEIQNQKSVIQTLVTEGGSLQHRYEELTKASIGLGKSARAAAEDHSAGYLKIQQTLNASEAGFRRTAAAAELVGRALGTSGASYNQVIVLAQKLGISHLEAATNIAKAADTMKMAVVSAASTITDSLAEMVVSGQANFAKLAGSLLQTFGSALKQIGEMWLATDLMMSMGIGPQSIGAAIGVIALGSLIEAVGSKISAGTSGAAESSAAPSSTGVSGAATTPGATGVGGTAVSSAQQTVNNNITIQLAVEALDLAAVSDAQMRSLSNRIARLIAQGAQGGQFSLAGA